MIIQSIRWVVLASCMSVGLFSAAPASATEGSVNLVAVLKDAPAFTPVEWNVFRLDNNSTVKKTNAHSLNLPLDPGNYRAVAHYGSVTRDRTFTVSSTGQVDIVIAMDK
jgi:hypothetical protein